jgi:hypothetical protein
MENRNHLARTRAFASAVRTGIVVGWSSMPSPRLSLRSAALSVTLGVVALARSSDAATLYVDGNIGSSTCATYDPGTRACGSGSATAYRTLDATFPVADAGDVVLVRAGTYAEGERVGPVHSGRAGAPITFRAFDGEAVHIRGTLDARSAASTTSSPFDLSGLAFIDIEGFELSHYGLCIRLDGTTDVNIRRMNIHDCGHGVWITNHSARVEITDLVSSHNSFRDGGASVNIRGASSDIRVERASATNNEGDPSVGAIEGDGFHTDDEGNARLTFIDCIATDNEDDGFDITATDVRLERCTSARNIVGFKLWDEHCDPSSCDPSAPVNRFTLVNVISHANRETGLFAQNGPNVEIYNSVFANNMYEGLRFVQNRATFPDPVASAVMQNDIVVSNGSWGRRFDSAGADNTDWTFTSDHNVFFDNGNGNAVWSGEDPSTITSDPVFVSASTGDFHLRASSPAIDTGRDLSSMFTTDADGRIRPAGGGWDRGAYEYGALAPSDAGFVEDAAPDAADDGDSARDVGSTDATTTADVRVPVDAVAAGDGGHATRPTGCACHATAPRSSGASRLAFALLGAAASMRRRRSQHLVRRHDP